MYDKICASAQTLKTNLKIENLFDIIYFKCALESAAEIMNREVAKIWCKLFRFTVESVYTDEQDTCRFFLQIVYTTDARTQANTTEGQNWHEPVVARLLLQVHKKTERFYTSRSIFQFLCQDGEWCDSLLRACALLATQQFAYFSSNGQTVGFQGEPVSKGSQRIYEKLFQHIQVEINDTFYLRFFVP